MIGTRKRLHHVEVAVDLMTEMEVEVEKYGEYADVHQLADVAIRAYMAKLNNQHKVSRDRERARQVYATPAMMAVEF